MLYCLIVYFKIGTTHTAPQFFYFYLTAMLIAQFAASLGYFISTIFNSEETAVQVAPMIVLPLVLFAGFFTNIASYPGWVMWIQYLSPMRYGLEAFVQNEFLHRTYTADEMSLVDILAYDMGLWQCLVILAVLAVFWRLLSMICLRLLV